MLKAIDHVNLVVDDLEKMADFYVRLLNMKVTRRVTIRGSWVDRTVKLEGVKADVMYLDPPAGPRVELIRYIKPAGLRPQAVGESNTLGIRHLAFRVREIETMVQTLQEAGVKFFSEIQVVPTADVNYGGGVQKHLVYFHDPEGNLLELCEYKNRSGAGSDSSDNRF